MQTPTWRRLRPVVLIPLAAVALMAIAWVISHLVTDPRDEYVDDAARYCERSVGEELKAPGTAEFGEASVDVGENGRYVVSGSVDAQNSFGAMIRTGYQCTVDDTGDSWELVRVVLDD